MKYSMRNAKLTSRHPSIKKLIDSCYEMESGIIVSSVTAIKIRTITIQTVPTLYCSLPETITMSAIARQQKAKADTFTQEAENQLAKKSWFASKEKKYEDACELLEKAGNAYKVGGFYYEAGQAYHRCGTIQRDDLKNGFDASKAFQNAGECFRQGCTIQNFRIS